MDLIGPDLALDLLNTGAGVHHASVDPLDGGPRLRTWLLEAGLLDGAVRVEEMRSPPVTRLVGEEARRLRDAVAHLFEAHRNGSTAPEQAIYAVNRVLAAGTLSAALRFPEGGLAWSEAEAPVRPLALLAPVARSAAHVVTHVEPARLRRCAAGDCASWFVDASKGGRRRWCSMARCGNRAKAARHRRKEKERADG